MAGRRAGSRKQPQGLPHAQPVGQGRVLQLAANEAADRPWGGPGVVPQHEQLAVVGAAQALQALDCRRLARAVGTEQADNLAVVDLERDVGDGDRRAVALPEVADAYSTHSQLPRSRPVESRPRPVGSPSPVGTKAPSGSMVQSRSTSIIADWAIGRPLRRGRLHRDLN